MARPGKPWWWSARGRWAATVEGARQVAPPEIGKGDEHAAWAWHASLLRKEAPVATGAVESLCEAYLRWDEGRVSAGARDRRSHECVVSLVQRICDTAVKGQPFGRMRLARVKPDHLEALMARWSAEKLSAGYRRALASRTKTVFLWASRRCEGRAPLVTSSPFAGMPMPAVPRPAERYASRAEAAAWLMWVWRTGRREYALLQRCLIHTGARPSELTRATWDELTWNGDRPAVITRADWKSAKKTGRPRRVYLPKRLHRAIKRRQGGGDRIFATDHGRPWTRYNLSNMTTYLRRRAIADGVPLLDEGPDRLTCYRWRHTAASSLLMSGVPISTVAQLLGTSPQMIASTYGHVLSDHLADAAESLSRRKS